MPTSFLPFVVVACSILLGSSGPFTGKLIACFDQLSDIDKCKSHIAMQGELMGILCSVMLGAISLSAVRDKVDLKPIHILLSIFGILSAGSYQSLETIISASQTDWNNVSRPLTIAVTVIILFLIPVFFTKQWKNPTLSILTLFVRFGFTVLTGFLVGLLLLAAIDILLLFELADYNRGARKFIVAPSTVVAGCATWAMAIYSPHFRQTKFGNSSTVSTILWKSSYIVSALVISAAYGAFIYSEGRVFSIETAVEVKLSLAAMMLVIFLTGIMLGLAGAYYRNFSALPATLLLIIGSLSFASITRISILRLYPSNGNGDLYFLDNYSFLYFVSMFLIGASIFLLPKFVIFLESTAEKYHQLYSAD